MRKSDFRLLSPVTSWYTAHIFLKPDTYAQRDNVLVDMIEPIVDKLEKAGLIENFHFLFEPNLEILFRLRLKKDVSLESVKSIAADRLKGITSLSARIDYEETYPGEGDMVVTNCQATVASLLLDSRNTRRLMMACSKMFQESSASPISVDSEIGFGSEA